MLISIKNFLILANENPDLSVKDSRRVMQDDAKPAEKKTGESSKRLGATKK